MAHSHSPMEGPKKAGYHCTVAQERKAAKHPVSGVCKPYCQAQPYKGNEPTIAHALGPGGWRGLVCCAHSESDGLGFWSCPGVATCTALLLLEADVLGRAGRHIFSPSHCCPHQQSPWALMMQVLVPQQRSSSWFSMTRIFTDLVILPVVKGHGSLTPLHLRLQPAALGVCYLVTFECGEAVYLLCDDLSEHSRLMCAILRASVLEELASWNTTNVSPTVILKKLSKKA